MSVDNQAGESLKALLESNGWTSIEELPGSLGFRRQHRVGDYLWAEELDLNACERLTYIQLIRARRSALDRALGETAKRYAHVAGELLAANVPFSRTGLGKMRAYQKGEVLARAAGTFLAEDLIDSKKLFMLVHKLPDAVEIVIEADSAKEASVHIESMRELVQPFTLRHD